MAEIAQGMPNLQKEMRNFQVIMMMQNNKVEEMQQKLTQMAQTTPNHAEPMDTPIDIDPNAGD